ncbi:hypothetical protein PHYSODRAFT_387940, partial [Phytophthora sojae]
VGKETGVKDWDRTVTKCVECKKTVRRRERQRSTRYASKLYAQARAQLLMRNDLIEAKMEDQRAEHMIRAGNRMERTSKRIRW